jgi:hypothetical protein
MSGLALPYTANLFIFVIPYDVCLFPAQFYHIIVYIRKAESRVLIPDRYVPWEISDGAENLVLYALQV